ncbi:MAG: hypothetical protein K2M56_03890, partial [Muribaculaceae bacterium]|nr:hypothetical protein [Muribaculaceae bacterium]
PLYSSAAPDVYKRPGGCRYPVTNKWVGHVIKGLPGASRSRKAPVVNLLIGMIISSEANGLFRWPAH